MVETNTITKEGCEVEQEKVEEREVKSVWCQLPPELKVRIASFLFAGDSTVFRRLVSKSLASSLGTVAIPIKPQHRPEIPYLISLYGDNFLNFYHPTLMCSYGVQLQELSEARIRSSSHGWLLLSTADGDVFFFEPFSKEKIQLPKCPRDTLISMCFSSPPTSTDCFVLGIDMSGSEITIIRHGKTRWTNRSLSRHRGQRFFVCAGVSPIVLNGLCYCLGEYGNLGVFDPNDRQPNLRVLGDCYQEDLYHSIRQSYLMARSSGEILRILVVGNKKVQCSKLNIKQMSKACCRNIKQMSKACWRKETSLGDNMLFLSSTSSFMGSTHLRGMHNKIYFSMFHEDALLFYSLHHMRYLSFQSDYSSKDCTDGVRDIFSNSAWMIPVSSNIIGGEW